MQKKVLSEISLYRGDVAMPKHWEIDPNELSHHILHSNLANEKFKLTRTWNKLNTYIREHIRLKYNINLINIFIILYYLFYINFLIFIFIFL